MNLKRNKEAHAKTLRSKDAKKILCVFASLRLCVSLFRFKFIPYITSIERHGIEKGLQQGLQLGVLKKARQAILNVLQVRFKNISLPPTLAEMIKGIDKEEVLDTLHEQSITVESVPAFEQTLAKLAGKNGSALESSAPSAS